jgi:L-threonylcarbamoyladenylate synthase
MTRRYTVDAQNPDPAIIAEAVALIREGNLIVVPTDTAYGLAGDPSNPEVVQRVLAIKNRANKPGMPLLVTSLNQARHLGSFTPLAEELARQFWPGALTLIVSAQQPYPPGIIGPDNSLALRMPKHAVPLRITDALQAPIIGTSANKTHEPSPRTATAANAQIGSVVDCILDAGPTPLRQDSTILHCITTPLKILREGALPLTALRPWLPSKNSKSPGLPKGGS